jgi:hypothetical protein
MDRELLRRRFEPFAGEDYIFVDDGVYGDENVTFTQVNYVHKEIEGIQIMVIFAEPIPYEEDV